VSDDIGGSEEIQDGLEWMAEAIHRQLETGVPAPLGFYGNASARIFRDFVYLAKFPFIAGYKRYTDMNLFRTFPQKKYKVRFLTQLLRWKTRWVGFSKTLKDYNLTRAASFRKLLKGE
jgi:hypothetical protein